MSKYRVIAIHNFTSFQELSEVTESLESAKYVFFYNIKDVIEKIDWSKAIICSHPDNSRLLNIFYDFNEIPYKVDKIVDCKDLFKNEYNFFEN